MKKPPNKRVTPRAASFSRIAKTLRVMAAAYRRVAVVFNKKPRDLRARDHWLTRAEILRDIATEFSNEARTLRAQR